MRRIVLAVVSTVAALVLLFSYRTSLPHSVAISTASGAAHVVSRPATSGAATTAGSQTTSAPATTGEPTDDGAVTVPATAAAKSSSAGTTAAKTTAAKTTVAGTTPAQSTTSKASAPVVVDGASTDTQFGPVQVEVTITAGKITAATAIVYPTQSSRDQEINSYAIPQLQQQVVAAQSATIDGVGGATYTTEGFVASLQSALDAAHFTG